MPSCVSWLTVLWEVITSNLCLFLWSMFKTAFSNQFIFSVFFWGKYTPFQWLALIWVWTNQSLDLMHFKALVNFRKTISIQTLEFPEGGVLGWIFIALAVNKPFWMTLYCLVFLTNSNLVAAYEKAKKKHQNKLKKLESQMMAMVERHETQVRMLKQRIALLEEENSRPHTNETSL